MLSSCRLLFVIILTLLPTSLFAEGNIVLVRTVAELAHRAIDAKQPDVSFLLIAKVNSPLNFRGDLFAVEDTTGAIILRDHTVWGTEFKAGDQVQVSGYTHLKENGTISIRACTLKVLEHGIPPPPISVSATDLQTGKFRFKTVCLKGSICDITNDDIYNDSLYISIRCADGIAYACTSSSSLSPAELLPLAGSEVKVTGLCINETSNPISRQLIGYHISFNAATGMQILKKQTNCFDLPEIDAIHGLPPSKICTLDRHRIQGLVIAVWDQKNVLIRSGKTLHHIVLFSQDPPSIGQQIEAVGFPGTNLYTISLSLAIWRQIDALREQLDAPIPTTATQLVHNTPNGVIFAYGNHGKAIQLRGVVRSLPAPGTNRMFVECSNIIVPVVIDALGKNRTEVEIGCEVAVSGTWVLQANDWKFNTPFPKIESAFLVTRQSDDLTILHYPPWWTPLKLTIVIAIMTFAIGAVLIWNRSLQVLAVRKSRELFRAQIEKSRSEFRIEERTRLAAELHDYTAQNLTAISYQIAAAEEISNDASNCYLQNAGNMLHSTLTDLRRCLWDLKNDTLDNPDFSDALLETVMPVSGDANIKIRFNVHRSAMSDKIAHAVLSICRELVSNAVRHGEAKKIHISGELKENVVRFMVHDNGSGFDPSKRQTTIGHFGLDGIAERIKRLEGTLCIKSRIGSGAKVIVTMPIIPRKQVNSIS